MDKSLNNQNYLNEDELEDVPNSAKIAEESVPEDAPVDIRRYHDRAGLSVGAMDFGLWYVEHRQKIVEYSFFGVFLTGLAMWLFFFYQFGLYAFKGIKAQNVYAQEILGQRLPPYNFYSERAAQSLELYPVKTILGSLNKRDIIGLIRNPSQKHSARFDYSFLNNGERINTKKGFILPGETKQLLELGRDIPESIGGLSLLIENISWSRASPHQFGVWEKFRNEHLNIIFSSIVFAPSENSSLTEKMPLNNLSFIADNKTSYNYWNVPIIISLYNYSDLIGVSTYEINDFESQENRNISITWPGSLRKVTDIKIEPDLDITRADIYKEFKVPTGTFR